MSKKTAIIAVLAVIVLLPVVALVERQHTLRQIIITAPNGAVLSAEVVSGIGDRMRGLSNREYLSYNEAMLFVFPDVGMHGIWMKDMRFPIDIIWLDEQQMVITIESNVSPDSYPKVFNPVTPAKYVVEVNAGWAMQNEVEIKTKLNFKL